MIFVIGDEIKDIYRWGTVSRLCPEAPVPVFVQTHTESRPGGAALVAANLKALGEEVIVQYGLLSTKIRYMAGRHLLLREDHDSFGKYAFDPATLRESIRRADAVVVSDYGKGTINESDAKLILTTATVPVFVDSKNNHEWWEGAFACFPNRTETAAKTHHVIRKLGEDGCEVDGMPVRATRRQVYDVTGAGDVFIAAFVSAYLKTNSLIASGAFANHCAGASVEHLGTYVLRPSDLKER